MHCRPALIVACLACAAWACEAKSPPRGPEATCARSCEAHDRNCTQRECWRGCNLVLDRLVEHAGDRVVACVAEMSKTCGDRVWARCAVRIGPHADGGPPAPPPPPAFEDFDQE